MAGVPRAPQLKGAHCSTCRERGPDLWITTWAPTGTVAEISFSCGRCGARVRFIATREPAGWHYTRAPES